eukprot:2018009-Prymnesium_polylepis.1
MSTGCTRHADRTLSSCRRPSSRVRRSPTWRPSCRRSATPTRSSTAALQPTRRRCGSRHGSCLLDGRR